MLAPAAAPGPRPRRPARALDRDAARKCRKRPFTTHADRLRPRGTCRPPPGAGRPGTAPAFAAALAEVPGNASPNILPPGLSGSLLPYVFRLCEEVRCGFMPEADPILSGDTATCGRQSAGQLLGRVPGPHDGGEVAPRRPRSRLGPSGYLGVGTKRLGRLW